MIFLDNGGIVIDTPGLREIQVWDVKEGISSVFEDVEKYIGSITLCDGSSGALDMVVLWGSLLVAFVRLGRLCFAFF